MLERQGLILAAWHESNCPSAGRSSRRTPPPGSGGRCRPLLDRDNQQRLGVVRERLPALWPPVRWLARRTYEVLETEDESLLLSLVSPWGLFRPWEVFDAEDRLICTIHAGSIYDSAGQARARQIALADPLRQSFVTNAGEELAWFRPVHKGVELVFLPLVQDDPYAKMSLLAATLAVQEERRRP